MEGVDGVGDVRDVEGVEGPLNVMEEEVVRIALAFGL